MKAEKGNKISWKRVLLFLGIATLISNIFRFDIFEIRPSLEYLPSWVYILSVVFLEGSGVLIGALVIIPYLKKAGKVEMSLFGTSKPKSLIMAIIPIAILIFLGVKNDFAMDEHIYGLVASLGTLCYCIMEEYGWRGYLQEELKCLEAWKKYAIIGFMWYLWHLTFLTKASVGDNVFFLSMMIFGSWGIGQVATSTKSIVASACFHMIIQIMMLNALIKNGIGSVEKTVVLGVSVVIWFVIIKKWEKENGITNKPQEVVSLLDADVAK